jgi:dolichol-phosphate mannosyltransferase
MPPCSSSDRAAPAPNFSIVIPAKDEAENLPGLFDEIAEALRGLPFEVIVVDDGSSDGTAAVMRAEMARRPWLRALRHRESAGKSAALRSGVLAARAPIIVTMDGDGQNNPADVPRMLDLMAGGGGIALVAAERRGRTDSGLKQLASQVANAVRARLLGDGTRDTANGLKAIRRDVFLALPFFDTMHRFLPALVVRDGLRVGHVEVTDRARRHGRSKYGVLDRLAVGLPDLFGVWWLRRRRRAVPWVEEIRVDQIQAEGAPRC